MNMDRQCTHLCLALITRAQDNRWVLYVKTKSSCWGELCVWSLFPIIAIWINNILNCVVGNCADGSRTDTAAPGWNLFNPGRHNGWGRNPPYPHNQSITSHCEYTKNMTLEAWYLRRNKLWLIPREIFWSGAVVDRQLWNSWRCQSSQEYPVQSLFKTLSGTEPGSNEPCFIWQTHQISVFGTSNKTLRNQASLLIA